MSGHHFPDYNIHAMQNVFSDGRDPFCTGMSAIPDHQRHLYYTHGEQAHHIEFSKTGSDDLDALYRACKPAEFGRNGQNVFDDSCGKAGRMDLVSFATLFNPACGIHKPVSDALVTLSHAMMDIELYELNVYGKGDFSEARKDTPRGQNTFGSLVVVFPTPHEGGQLVLRKAEKEWTLDFADKFASATEPSVFFVAFYRDVEHEVLPVTSGYRVMLTYNLNLHPKPTHPNASSVDATPSYLKLKQALIDLVNDKSKLPNGGYFGFGLVHEYVHTGYNLIEPLWNQLKGSDLALADVCDKLGLPYSLKLFYRNICGTRLHLISTKRLRANPLDMEIDPTEYLAAALDELTIKEAEGIVLVGQGEQYLGDIKELDKFFGDPITEVMEITLMRSSVDSRAPMITCGDRAQVEYAYGTVCMFVAVEPAESRDLLGM